MHKSMQRYVTIANKCLWFNPLSASCSSDARMGGLDVRHMGCSSLTAHMSNIYPSEDTFRPVALSLLHFNQDIRGLVSPFCAKCLQFILAGCHMVPVALKGLTYHLQFWMLLHGVSINKEWMLFFPRLFRFALLLQFCHCTRTCHLYCFIASY